MELRQLRYYAARNQQYSIYSFATLQVLSCLHGPGFYDLETRSLVQAVRRRSLHVRRKSQ